MANTIEVHVDVLVENGNESSEVLLELKKKKLSYWESWFVIDRARIV